MDKLLVLIAKVTGLNITKINFIVLFLKLKRVNLYKDISSNRYVWLLTHEHTMALILLFAFTCKSWADRMY